MFDSALTAERHSVVAHQVASCGTGLVSSVEELKF
jgi:hypothetical protein